MFTGPVGPVEVFFTGQPQWRIQGGFEGFVRTPPLAGESSCTTTPPVDKHPNELFFLLRPLVVISLILKPQITKFIP